MITALMTSSYAIPSAELGAARDWYARAFAVTAYFEEPFYVGFNVAGYELGLIPKEAGEADIQLTGNIAYWGCENLDKSFAHFLACGAAVVEAPTDVGGDIRVARLRDPWGNLLGLIENPHFHPAADENIL